MLEPGSVALEHFCRPYRGEDLGGVGSTSCDVHDNRSAGLYSMDTGNHRKEEMIPLTEQDRNSDDETPTSTARILFKFFCILFVILILVSLIFCGGLLTGYSIFSTSDQRESPSFPSARTNWGESVDGAEGEAVSVLRWLDTELKGINIKENLRLEIFHSI